MKRRNFIKSTAPMVALPWFNSGLGVSAFSGLPFFKELFAPTATDKVLVIVQMTGGNDGLNMVIPIDQYSALSAARANILIPQNQVLPLNGLSATGLHPKMTAMQQMYNNGKLAIVQGVSYPNHDMSHFRGTDIWNTASDANQVLTSGWVGRYLAYEYPNYPQGYPNTTMPDPLALQVGAVLSPIFQGGTQNMAQTVPLPDTAGALNLAQVANATADPPPATNAGYELAFLRGAMQQANSYATVIQAAWNAGTNSVTYPAAPTGGGNTKLAQQLRTVARLIKGGLKTRVYLVNIGSFDTHSDQVDATAGNAEGEHAALLKELSDAIGAFQQDLEALAIADRVLGMTFSEFGRRIVSNGSLGTDHGKAAPMFLFGTQVRGGMTGTNPIIPAAATANDNVAMQHDYRAIYRTILQNWFCLQPADAQNVLLHTQQPLDLTTNACAVVGTQHQENQRAGDAYVRAYPNPASHFTTVQFESNGTHLHVALYDALGHSIAVLVDSVLPNGVHSIEYNVSHLPAGTYFLRYQTNLLVQTKSLIVVK
jgi:uncharacterized protein (DUF1501 family)